MTSGSSPIVVIVALDLRISLDISKARSLVLKQRKNRTTLLQVGRAQAELQHVFMSSDLIPRTYIGAPRAAINILIRMWGNTCSPRLFERISQLQVCKDHTTRDDEACESRPHACSGHTMWLGFKITIRSCKELADVWLMCMSGELRVWEIHRRPPTASKF